jgi:hypothetical protein
VAASALPGLSVPAPRARVELIIGYTTLITVAGVAAETVRALPVATLLGSTTGRINGLTTDTV